MRRSIKFFPLVLLVAAGLLISTAGQSLAAGGIMPGIFELDGNVKHDAQTTPPDDWANMPGSSLKFTGITEDVVNGTQKASTGATNVCPGILPAGSTLTTCDDVATGGNTKDDLDFSQWNWIWQAANDKNDIEHTFAAQYKDTTVGSPTFGHNFIVFGLDKLSNSGSASVGFWFTKQDISLTNPGPPNNSPAGKFNGTHTQGDLLVQSDFTSGGSVSRVEVFVWCNSAVPATPCASYPGPASHPNLISQGQQAFDCTLATPTSGFCGIATQASTTNVGTAWPFLYKFSGGVASSSTYPPSTFFEGGVDTTKLFGSDVPCFSTGIGETRQSQSETSVLVDFHLFNFAVCDYTITKTGDTLSKVGDAVNYTITLHNTGIGTLYKKTITDAGTGWSGLGNLTAAGSNLPLSTGHGTYTSNCGASLAPDDGAAGGPDECTITVTRTTQAGDPDPMTDTVTSVYNNKAALDGTNFTRSDDHTVNLFQPGVGVTKACTDLSKVGDTVNCTVTITNTSSADSPALVRDSILDTVKGDLTNAANFTNSTCGTTLATGGSCQITYSYTVPAGAADPYPNTVTVHYHPTDFPNDITANASDSVNLFVPGVQVTKACTDLSKVGDRVDCTVTITNTSDSDSPALVLNSISDTVQGNLTLAANYDASDCGVAGATLAFGAHCTITYHYTVPAGAADPYPNTVTVHYHPAGFTNDISDTDSDSVNLFQPSVDVGKTCSPGTVQVGQTVTFTCTIHNTSSSDSPHLILTSANDSLVGNVAAQLTAAGCNDLAPGATCSFTYTYTVQASDPDTLTNTITVHYHPAGFTNDITDSASCSVNVQREKAGLFPTETTCTAFAGGNAAPLTEMTYGLTKQGKINNTSPGVFFYYATFTVSSQQNSLALDVNQFFSPDSGALDTTSHSTDWIVQQGQAFIYQFVNGTCTKLTAQIQGSPSDVEIIYSPNGGVPAGTYVLGVKYTQSPTLIGSLPCHGTGPSCRYYFVPSQGTTHADDTLLTNRATFFTFHKR
jgi:hypothetical protein